MMKKSKKAILVISSHVIRGAVGSRSSVFVFEQFGFPVWQMITVSLPWQPDHGPSHRLVVPDKDFSAICADIATCPWVGEIGTVLTGYFGTPSQVGMTADLISTLKANNPELVYYCDPIIGNDDGLYVDAAIAVEIRDRLLPMADFIKPNRTELEWFVNRPLNDNEMIIDAVHEIGAKKALITSAFAPLKDATANLYMDENGIWLAEHRKVTNPVSGLGDLTGALFYARRLCGEDVQKALYCATASVQTILDNTLRAHADELMITNDREALLNPHAPIEMRYKPYKE